MEKERKIEELLQPSTRIRKLQWIWQTADGNFTTNHRLFGKKNGSHMMTELFSPLGRPTRPGFTFTSFLA